MHLGLNTYDDMHYYYGIPLELNTLLVIDVPKI